MDNDSAVVLSPVHGDRDYELLAEWCTSRAGVYASGTQQNLSPTDIQRIIEQGPASFLMVRANGSAVGAVHWERLTYAGSYKAGSIIGDPELWGSGFGLDSLRLLMEFLFHAQNAHRIQVTAGIFNKAMVEFFCSGLLRIEGVLRDYYFLDGEYHDAVIGSLLRDEYYALVDAYQIVPPNTISEGEKEQARKLLLEHLALHPIKISRK